MAHGKRFVVLGLGTFGTALATRLADNGCRVTGVDSSERSVEALQDKLYEALVADVTDRQAIEHLVLSTAEAVFISLGEQIERSILSALHCKELGARRICVKGVSDDHGKILRAIGVDRVIFPEREIAVQLADDFTWPNVIKGLQIDPDYSIVELAVPPSQVGKTLIEADFRRRFGIYVLAVKDALHGNVEAIPHGDFRLTDDQILFVIGKQSDLRRFSEQQ